MEADILLHGIADQENELAQGEGIGQAVEQPPAAVEPAHPPLGQERDQVQAKLLFDDPGLALILIWAVKNHPAGKVIFSLLFSPVFT